MADKKSPMLAVGCDDGHAEIKIITEDGRRYKCPSHAKAGTSRDISFNNATQKTYTYQTKEGPYTVGDIAVTDPTNFNDYPFSAMNRVLVHHGLKQAGIATDASLHVCTGLPLKRYFLGTSENSRLIEKKELALLVKDVEAPDRSAMCQIMKHSVFAEGVTAWLDYVSTIDHQKRAVKIDTDLIHAPIAIVDIGGRTTDVPIVEDFSLVDDSVNTIDAGMLNIHQRIKEMVYEQHEEVELHESQLQQAIQTGSVTLWGKSVNIQSIVNESVGIIASQIKSTIKKQLGSGAHVHQVVFVGGTTEVLKPHLLGLFKNQVFSPDPSFANASGMLKYTLLIGD